MGSQSLHQPPQEPSRPALQDQAGLLTQEQQNFAQVLGQALAEAWGRHLRPAPRPESSSPRKR
jgi:hypothetical protein